MSCGTPLVAESTAAVSISPTDTRLERADRRPTKNVTFGESIYLFYTSVNAVYLVDMFLLELRCVGGDFCDYDSGLLYGSAAGALGFLLFLLTASFHRFVVRTMVYRSLGRGCSKGIRVVYLCVVAAMGIALGALCAHRSMTGVYFSKKINEQAQLLSAPVIWTLVGGVGIFTMLILTGLSLPLAVYFGFIVLPGDDSQESQSGAHAFLRKIGGGGGRRRRGDSTSSDDSPTGRSTPLKFRSEEAFSAAVSFAEKSTYDKKEEPEKTTPTRRRGSAAREKGGARGRAAADQAGKTQSKMRQRKPPKQDDAAYANFLEHKQKVVRSISQYEDEEGETGSKKPMPKAEGGGGGGGGGKNRRQDVPPKTETIDTTDNSASTKGYGQHLLKVGGKIKSVSHYETVGKGGRNAGRR